MRKEVLMTLALTLVLGLCWGANAQIVPENHYLVYDLANTYTVDNYVTLYDQFNQWFDDFSTNNLILEKFANPVDKNGEGIFNEMIHQTWWWIDDPQETKHVGFFNQFGNQMWEVGNGRYLVLPALKDQPGGSLPPWNHYKCYEAEGPRMDIDVLLHDQWGGFSTMVGDPVLFCNPCIKELANGERYEIEMPQSHLAVYRLEPTLMGDFPATAIDQFGEWQINAVEAIWLVVPTEKLTVVESETRTWGGVKSLYR